MTRATANEGLQSQTIVEVDGYSFGDEFSPDIFSGPVTTPGVEGAISSDKETPSVTTDNSDGKIPETLQPNSSASETTKKSSETKETAKSTETTKTTTSGTSSATTSKPAPTSKSATTSKPATTTSKPATTSKSATTQKPTTAAPQQQVVNLPYNVYCNDTPETGNDEQYIKALYWNCYLRYYELGQVNNSEITVQKAVIADKGREHLKYEVMMKSDEFQCLILAGSCNGVAARPTISANKVGSCDSVNDYKFGGVPNASSIRVDHACNR